MKFYRTFLLAAGTSLFFACNGGAGKQSDNDTISKESAKAADTNVDTASMNNGGSTGNMKPDTAVLNPASNPDSSSGPRPTVISPSVTASTANATSTASAKPNPAKKGHKGHVRVAIYNTNAKARMEADKNGIYGNAEVIPLFPGGENALDKFVENNIQYPQDAVDNGVEGTVTVKFAVDETGKVYSPQVVSVPLGYGLDNEALAVINKMPRWSPGRMKGKNVKAYYNLPITFTLQ